MQADPKHPTSGRSLGAPGRRGRRRLRTLLLVFPLTLLLFSIGAATAQAEDTAEITFTCKAVTFKMSGFPNVPKNVVKLQVRVDGVITQKVTYEFSGPTGEKALIINLPPGHHGLDGKANWTTNGVKGGVDTVLPQGINCGNEPDFAIEKLQKKDGGVEPFTTSQLTYGPGELGTVDYEIIVFNDGNMPLKFGPLNDPKCDEGTITGGPGGGEIAPNGTTTFFCKHVLTKADKEAGSYTNAASIAGEPAGGPAKEKESNTVVAVLTPPDPNFTIEKKQKLEAVTGPPKYPTSGPYTTATLPLGHVGQVVSYEIIVKNTGNVPLKFSPLEDAKCDGGTITGGPGEALVPVGGSTTYNCKHTLTEADRTAGKYTNTATTTGTPPPEAGEPVSKESNTVIVELPKPDVEVKFSCNTITFYFTGFPNVPNNKVNLSIRVDKVLTKTTFTFNGSEASYTFTVNLGPGRHSLDGRANWKTNQFGGGRDIFLQGGIVCNASPAFTLEKLQRNSQSQEPFTTSTLPGEVGEVVAYEVIAKNTGNVPLKFSEFSDAECDEGTLEGGPGETAVNPGNFTVYTCQHTVTEADGEAGSITNVASLTGAMVGGGTPFSHESNAVVTEPIT